MRFSEIIEQASELLRRKGRITYRTLKREFDLDDGQIEDLKEELLFSHPEVKDTDGRGLVWTDGSGTNAPSSPTTPNQQVQPSTVSPQTPSRPAPLEAATGERRQLTVMFCDLVGSTALSEQLDPEELHQMVRAYQQACAAVINRYEGHIAQYLGDGLLVYFGYPAAHEDDAIRSVRSSLEILDSLQQLELARPLQVRIGIHTGHVVVGEVGGEGKTEQLALGDTPNIAARVQGKAEPNTTLISADTYHLVQGYFTCTDLGPQDLKGISAPLTLYTVEGEGEAQNRFDVSVQKGLTPLVGREEESELLERRWERAKAGEGQVVLLSGEAGIGKSRLVRVLRDHTAEDKHFGAVFRCSPFYQNSALYPVIDRLQRTLQITREDTPATKLRKLTHMLTLAGMADQETITLLATLLSIPLPEDHPPLQLSPQKQKEKTLHTLVAWLQNISGQQPVRLEIEDLHWADPSTVELLGLLIDQIASSRILVLLTFRPEFSPPWPTQAHMLPIQLSRLPQKHIEGMIQRVAGKGLPDEVVQQLIAKSDGVPLYVEEMTKNLLESGLLTEKDGQFETAGPLPQLAIPTTLQDSFASRLDRLAPVRELAQIGAVLGREFSYELIQAVAKLDEATLQEGLRQLREAEILYQRGVPPQATYTFKHALLQDASYESLLKSKRQQLHTQTAQVLEQQFQETIEAHPELIAHHYTEATLIEQAISYWQKAGERAAQQFAHAEAISHLQTGLNLLQMMPDNTERMQTELAFQIFLGTSLITTKGYGVPEIETAYSRAWTICQQLGDIPQLQPVLHGLKTFYEFRGKLQTAREIDTQILQLAEGSQNPAFISIAHGGVGQTLFYLGELALAKENFEQSMSLYHPHMRSDISFLWIEPEFVNLSFLAWILWHMGYLDQALKRSQEAVALAGTIAQPFSLGFAHSSAALFYFLRREDVSCQHQAKAAIAISTEHGLPSWLAIGTVYYGATLVQQGHREDGLTQIQKGASSWKAMGTAVIRSLLLGLWAQGCGQVGRWDEGSRLLDEALAFVTESSERFYEAELHRLRGEFLLQDVGDNASEAETCFQKSLDVSRHQQAKSLELRAAMSLARLWQQQGKTTEAHDLLAPVYNWFTEGFDTADLKDAKALLDELNQGFSHLD